MGNELSTVPHVDLHRYAGLWYEIARYPNVFQSDSAVNVTARYILMNHGKLHVINSEQEPDGEAKHVEGVAYPEDATNAKLKVDFGFGIPGDYWIVYLNSDYTVSVVSNPLRTHLWILSKTPTMDRKTYRRLTMYLNKELAFDTYRLVKTKHTNLL
jgi:apolipoprotein D and lipocalin family protein